jgi:hypothetical protein
MFADCTLLITLIQCSDTPADEPCTRCRGIELTAKIWKMPCLRARITEVEIFRTSMLPSCQHEVGMAVV